MTAGPRLLCRFAGCQKPGSKARGYCAAHYRSDGRPLAVPIGRAGPEHYRHAEAPGYTNVHQRLHRERGPAWLYDCALCGHSAPGRPPPGQPAGHEWALIHDERTCARTDDEAREYSPNLADYLALCVPCHRRYDASYRRELTQLALFPRPSVRPAGQ